MGKLWRSKFASVFLILIIAGLGLALFKLHKQKSSVAYDTLNLENKIASTQKSSDYLEKFLAQSGNNSFLEREAKIKLNYKEADENVAIVYRDLNAKASVSGAIGINFAELPNWQKWWYYFLGK